MSIKGLARFVRTCHSQRGHAGFMNAFLSPSALHAGSSPPTAVISPTSIKLSRAMSTRGSATPTSRKKTAAAPPVSINFIAKAIEMIDNVEIAIKPILPLNPTYQMTRSNPEELVLNVGAKGSYIFKIDRDMMLLTVQTPISGVHQYDFEVNDGQWLSVIDGHDMRGLVTRDLLRHCTGLPNFK